MITQSNLVRTVHRVEDGKSMFTVYFMSRRYEGCFAGRPILHETSRPVGSFATVDPPSHE